MPRCPVSRSRNVVPIGETDGFRIWRCPDSATDFVWPAPSPAELQRYYDREEWFEGGERGGYADYDAQTVFSLPLVAETLAAFAPPPEGEAHYVLDVGCGYGTHLKMALDRGWKTFGIEPSQHARKIVEDRYRHEIQVVAKADELVPHEFDLVLMLDVLEHVSDPYALMFELFNRGLVGPKTRFVISTPNARSRDAIRDGADWVYRHPPSHLVFYSARSLTLLMKALLFEDVRVRGASALPDDPAASYPDETLTADESLGSCAGLVCEASGSRFYAFMLERYVPGTWSKLAEYEHVPRYHFARRLATGARVLDFGCGTGYGARYLADEATEVLGVDIDDAALGWARFWHDPARLRFEKHADLGATLPDASFDLATCFEMIEHVDHATQKATIASLARKLKPSGALVISTPNPAVTANYGDNPYHLREMTEVEFVELLAPCFAHVAIYRQWIRPSVLIGTTALPDSSALTVDRLGEGAVVDEPAAFIALCSHAPMEPLPALCSFDGSFDMVLAETTVQKTLTTLRFEKYLLEEAQPTFVDRAARAEAALAEKDRALAEKVRALAEMDRALVERDATMRRLQEESDAEREQARMEHERAVEALEARAGDLQRRHQASADTIVQRTAERDQWAAQYAALERTRFVRLARILRGNSTSRAPWLEATYLIAGGLLPGAVKRALQPAKNALRHRFGGEPVARAPSKPAIGPALEPAFKPYRVRAATNVKAYRPRVLHVIANFMTGGSSRLVVDLIEHLGGEYEQRVLTSFIPDPPNYVGVDIAEVRDATGSDAMREIVNRFNPDIVHVHYWGDVDEPWYRSAFEVVSENKRIVIQNVNTPVTPFADAPVVRNVFVSRYVLDHFGDQAASNIVIYPGSDFSLFAPAPRAKTALGCIGMVYRLERDKLDESAIEPFISAAEARPGLKCLIVGGGSLKPVFEQRVRDAGLVDSFEFTGYVSYETLPAIYRRMDVFVAPIWKESFGQVSAFAMNMGVPVVGYDIGAISEIVADPTLLAPAGDARALANVAVRLVRDDDARASIGLVNRQRAQRLFSVEAMIRAYRDLYREILTP